MARFYTDSNRLLSILGNRLIARYGSDGIAIFSLISNGCASSLDDGWCGESELEGIADLLRLDYDRMREIVLFLTNNAFLITDERGRVADPFVLEDRETLERKRETFRRNRGVTTRSSEIVSFSVAPETRIELEFPEPSTQKRSGALIPETRIERERGVSALSTQSVPISVQTSTQTSTQTKKTSEQTSKEQEHEKEKEKEPEKEQEPEVGGGAGGGSPPGLVDDWTQIAFEKLSDPTGSPEWTQKNAYISAGRRPMRDYPDVWLTPNELVTVCRDYEASGIPFRAYRTAFESAQIQATNQKTQRRDPSNAGAAGWLLGFIKQSILDSAIKETRLNNAREASSRV